MKGPPIRNTWVVCLQIYVLPPRGRGWHESDKNQARLDLDLPSCVPGVQSWEEMTCAVCALTMLADSDVSPVYTLPLVLCALVLPAGEAPSQGLEEAWQMSKGHPTQSQGWSV